MAHFVPVGQEAARLRRLPAFNRSGEVRVRPKPGTPTPRDSHLLEVRDFDAAKRQWSDWQSISVPDAQARWPDPPSVEAEAAPPLTLEQRVARIEETLRASGTLPPA